jgi:hypothetical protein
MWTEQLIHAAAGKNAVQIWVIDEDEDGGYLVWLRDGKVLCGYNQTSFAIDDNDTYAYVSYMFTLVE